MGRVRIIAAREIGGHFGKATIIDARRRREYAAGHIPGAIRMGWEQWCEPAPERAGSTLAQPGYWGVLAGPDEEWYGERLAAVGLLDDRPIVVYAGGPASRGREGRIGWMLLYLGAREVALLDGGWDAWMAAGGDVEIEAPATETGSFSVMFHPERRRTLDDLRQAWGAGRFPQMIDTRSLPEFAGEIDAYLPRMGRLPGARLAPVASFFEDDGRYVPRERYMRELAPLVERDKETVPYCEVGVRASLFALLHEAYTGEILPVYDGSLMEWSLSDLPMERG